MIDPHHPDPSEQRLTDLEIKASYTEDLVDTLNAIVARQQQLSGGAELPDHVPDAGDRARLRVQPGR